MKLGLIYMATDKILKKNYVGQTTSKLSVRKNKHKIAAYNKQNSKSYYSLFYKAIRFIGFENFDWQVLEDNIPEDQLDNKEIYYIRKYNAYDDGWNSSMGGNRSYNSKLKDEEVENIKKLLLENKKVSEVSELTGFNRDIISDINCGETWFDCTLNYPLTTNNGSKQRNFTDEELREIENLLINTDENLTQIARKFKCDKITIRKISNGEVFIYRNEKLKYPLREKCFEKLTKDDLKIIVNALNTFNEEISLSKIAESFNNKYNRKQISHINSGEYHKDEILSLFPDIKFPIRKTTKHYKNITSRCTPNFSES